MDTVLYSRVEGAGKPLLILHGFLGMSDNWKTLGSRFAEEGYEVHMLDLRNHGRSFHSDQFTYDDMVQDIMKYCQEHQLGTVTLLGHSMGGKVAMNFAVRYPGKVDRLIVADIGPKYYPPHHQDILSGLSAVDFGKRPDRNQVDEILQQHIPVFTVRQFLMKSLYWKEPGQLAFRFNVPVFLKEYEQIGKALDEDVVFDKPVLFIRGGKSDYIEDEDVMKIRLHFPQMILETIPNAGHWLHAEAPDLFYEITASFLKG